MRFEGKTVYVTGASSGIGAQLARELAGRGAAVGLLARREERLTGLTEELRAAGHTAAWREADVTDREALHAACDGLAGEIGEPDVAIANAGWNRTEPMSRFQPGKALAIYDTNLLGFLHLVDWVLPRFLERGTGQLVGVASLASYVGFPGNAAYCGSKAAMRVHLQSLRVALKRRGIAVTTLCPGFIESELTAKNPYKMPFLWKTDRACRYMADAIEKERGEVAFPWQMRIVVPFLLARVLPRALVERLIGRAG